MTYGAPARTPPRRIPRRLVAGLLVVLAVSAANAATLGHPLLASSPSLGEADGVVPDGTTVFDDEVAGIANLKPALLGALRRAAPLYADPTHDPRMRSAP